MKFKYNNKNEQEESYDFSVQLSAPELNFLINFAIESLIQIGAIAVQQNTTDEQEILLPLGQELVPPQVG